MNKKIYRKERDIERRAIFLITRAWPKVEHRKMNGYGFRSWPDRVFLFEGSLTIFIEFKKSGGELSPGQAYVRSLLKGLGFAVFTCDDPQQALVLCEATVSAFNKAKRHGN